MSPPFRQVAENKRPRRAVQRTEGASVLSVYWLPLTAGCLGGMALLKIFDSRKVPASLTILAMISLSFAFYGETKASKYQYLVLTRFDCPNHDSHLRFLYLKTYKYI